MKKYKAKFDEEERAEREKYKNIVKKKRKEVRDDFLNNFFLPLRQKYEDDIDKYKALFPIKEKDMDDKDREYKNIYQHGEVINSRKLEYM